MVGWHLIAIIGHEFEQALGVGDEQGSLACCIPWESQRATELTEHFVRPVFLFTCDDTLVLMKRSIVQSTQIPTDL